MNIRGQAAEGASNFVPGGVWGQSEGFERLLEVRGGGSGVGPSGVACARAFVKKVGRMQVRCAGLSSRHGMEAKVCVLDMKQGVEAKSVLETEA